MRSVRIGRRTFDRMVAEMQKLIRFIVMHQVMFVGVDDVLRFEDKCRSLLSSNRADVVVVWHITSAELIGKREYLNPLAHKFDLTVEEDVHDIQIYGPSGLSVVGIELPVLDKIYSAYENDFSVEISF